MVFKSLVLTLLVGLVVAPPPGAPGSDGPPPAQGDLQGMLHGHPGPGGHPGFDFGSLSGSFDVNQRQQQQQQLLQTQKLQQFPSGHFASDQTQDTQQQRPGNLLVQDFYRFPHSGSINQQPPMLRGTTDDSQAFPQPNQASSQTSPTSTQQNQPFIQPNQAFLQPNPFFLPQQPNINIFPSGSPQQMPWPVTHGQPQDVEMGAVPGYGYSAIPLFGSFVPQTGSLGYLPNMYNPAPMVMSPQEFTPFPGVGAQGTPPVYQPQQLYGATAPQGYGVPMPSIQGYSHFAQVPNIDTQAYITNPATPLHSQTSTPGLMQLAQMQPTPEQLQFLQAQRTLAQLQFLQSQIPPNIMAQGVAYPNHVLSMVNQGPPQDKMQFIQAQMPHITTQGPHLNPSLHNQGSTQVPNPIAPGQTTVPSRQGNSSNQKLNLSQDQNNGKVNPL